jgi:GntR family transcriptional regulator, arabinose operon transcriptional repressor
MAKACRFPVVFADMNIPGANCPAVIADGFHAGYTATRRLITGGLTKIGFLSNHAWATSMRDRYLGYRRALEEAGLPEVQPWVRLDPVMHPNFANPMAEPYRIARDYLRGAAAIEGVVCANDFLAIACAGVARELGLAVPADLRVVGIDNLAAASNNEPSITTYGIPNEEIGRRAFAVLNDLIHGRQPLVQEIQIRGELIVRQSG